MLRALTILLLFQFIGEVLAQVLALPIPGPVIGMLLLFVTLLARGPVSEELSRTAQHILGILALLFVPAGVGVMVHVGLLQEAWLAILLTLLGSTLITLLVTALTMHLLRRLERRETSL